MSQDNSVTSLIPNSSPAQEDVTMDEQDFAAPINVTSGDEEVNGQSKIKHAMVRDLPKFKILSDDMKDTSDAFVSVSQYFKAFERTFRMQNVNLEHNWKDNLANVIGIDHADWFADTIESNVKITYEEAKAMIMDHIESPAKAINMFNKLVSLKQKPGEPATDFGKRFIRAAHAAQCADSNFLARLFMNNLQPYLNLSVRTSLSSHLGISFLHQLKSFRQVEALISGLEVPVFDDPFVTGGSTRKKNHYEPKMKGEPINNHNANKLCKYCSKPWQKGHRCSEFLEHKRSQGHKQSQQANQVRSIKMNELIKDWTNFALNSNEDEAIDNAIANSEDNNCKCRSIKQAYNNLITNNPFSLYTPLLIQNNRAIGLVDTGSELSVMSKKFILLNKIPFVTNNNNAILKLAGKNNTINRLGRTEPIEIKYNGKISTHTFEIIEFDDNDQTDVILGYEILPKLGIALTGVAHNFDDAVIFDDSINDEVIPNKSPVGSVEQQEHFMKEIRPLLKINQSISKHSFCTVPESVIHLNTEKDKFVNIPQYPIPYKLRPKIQEQIETWIANGTIEKAPVNTKWNSPLTLAAKKDSQGNKSDTNKRVCLDTRALNNILLDDDVQSLPNIPDIFHKLAGHSVFSSFDAFSAFHRFEIYEPHRIKTAWTSPIDGTQFCFKGSPYGIKFLSNVYQRVMTRLFNDDYEYMNPSEIAEQKGTYQRRKNILKGHIAYFVDDLVCFSRNMEEHLIHVKEVIRILNKVNLILNIEKCHFAQKSINLLGFSVSAQGKTIDTRKISNIESWPRPKTGTDIQRFLGLVNYMRDHIPKASALMAPLDKIRNAKVITDKEWTPSIETHFQTIKKVLVSNVVLSPPDLNHPYTVYTDSSSYGIGCALCQEYIEEEKDDNQHGITSASSLSKNNESTYTNKGINTKPPVKKIVKYVGFMARSLSSSERNYSTTKRELLAIIFALQKFRKFLWGTKFQIMCDHRALTYIHTQKHANSMILNWFEYLQDFNFDVVYLPGVDNVLADRLSRLFPPMDLNLGEDVLDKNNKMSYKRKNKFKFKKINGTIRAIKIDNKNKFDIKHVEYKHGEYMTPPENERKALLLRAHVFGHFGAENIVKTLHNDGIHWPNLAVDAVELVKSCGSCQKHNITKRGYQPLRPIYSYIPGDHWSIDLAELPLSTNGYKYLLVMVDICTRFCILRCIKDKQATTLAITLVQVFSDFGYPTKISMDNGSENSNIINQVLCETMNIDRRLITSYNAASNGTAERFVQSAKLAIAKAVEGAGHQWDLYTPGVQLALNNKVSKRLNTPPFNLMFARKMNAFIDYTESDKQKTDIMSYNDLLKRIDHMNEVVFPAINDKTDKYVNNMRDKFDKYKNVVSDYPNGTHVMVRIPTLKGTLMPSYEGPYTIIRKTKGGSYVLQNETGILMDRDYAPKELKVVNKDNIDDDETYEIEGILEHRGTGKNTEYKIRWKGYSQEHDTWVTPEMITHESTIQQYWRRRLGKDYKPYKNSKPLTFTDTLKSNKKGKLQNMDNLLVPLQDSNINKTNTKNAETVKGSMKRKSTTIDNSTNQAKHSNKSNYNTTYRRSKRLCANTK